VIDVTDGLRSQRWTGARISAPHSTQWPRSGLGAGIARPAAVATRASRSPNVTARSWATKGSAVRAQRLEYPIDGAPALAALGPPGATGEVVAVERQMWVRWQIVASTGCPHRCLAQPRSVKGIFTAPVKRVPLALNVDHGFHAPGRVFVLHERLRSPARPEEGKVGLRATRLPPYMRMLSL
jgi:hypothetical protein